MDIGIRFEIWLANWVDLICAIITIITFTFWVPRWYLQIRCYFAKKRFERKIQNEN